MAKRNSETEENDNSVEIVKTEKVANKKTTLELRNPDSKLRLMTKKGSYVMISLEESLSEHYQRLLTDKSKKAITQGKTALQIVKNNLSK
jgi:NAD(P)H-flavin reductase